MAPLAMPGGIRSKLSLWPRRADWGKSGSVKTTELECRLSTHQKRQGKQWYLEL